jgi:hypothetical protein
MPRGGARPGAGRKRNEYPPIPCLCASCKKPLRLSSSPTKLTCSERCRMRLSRSGKVTTKPIRPRTHCSVCSRGCNKGHSICFRCRRRKPKPSIADKLRAGTYRLSRHGPIPDELDGLLFPYPLGPSACHRGGAASVQSLPICKTCGIRRCRKGNVCRQCMHICRVCGAVCVRSAKECLRCFKDRDRTERTVLTNCNTCGVDIRRPLSDIQRNKTQRNYCSIACSAIAARTYTPRNKKPLPLCQRCGKTCGNRRKFCSPQCRRRPSKPKQSRKVFREVSCIACGTKWRHWRNVTFCSRRCRRRLRKYVTLWSGIKDESIRKEMIRAALALKELNKINNDANQRKLERRG